MNKEDIWNCPICGNPYWNWMDALDHIVKAHIEEYSKEYYMFYTYKKDKLFS